MLITEDTDLLPKYFISNPPYVLSMQISGELVVVKYFLLRFNKYFINISKIYVFSVKIGLFLFIISYIFAVASVVYYIAFPFL